MIRKSIEYYIMGFNNCFNYKDSSMRCEFNFFILWYSVIYFVGFFVGFSLLIPYSIINNSDPTFGFKIFFGAIILYNLVHLLPSLSLVYRRIKDIFQEKTKYYYTAFVITWLLQIACPIYLYFKMNTLISNNVNIQPEHFLFNFFPIAIIGQILAIVMFGFVIFLMVKKGKLN